MDRRKTTSYIQNLKSDEIEDFYFSFLSTKRDLREYSANIHIKLHLIKRGFVLTDTITKGDKGIVVIDHHVFGFISNEQEVTYINNDYYKSEFKYIMKITKRDTI